MISPCHVSRHDNAKITMAGKDLYGRVVNIIIVEEAGVMIIIPYKHALFYVEV